MKILLDISLALNIVFMFGFIQLFIVQKMFENMEDSKDE